MKVYFIRHGQSVAAANDLFQGWTDTDLTEKGRNQARRAGSLLEGVSFKRIYASDITRATTTARIVFGEDADLIFDERIREINNSTLAGQRGSDVREKYGEIYFTARHNFDYTAFGAEGAEHFVERVRSFLDTLWELSKLDEFKNENVAVVTHGGVIQAVVALIYGAPLRNYYVSIDNCSISTIKAKHDLGVWKIDALNYTGKI